MKIKIIVFILVFFQFSAKSQSISLNELINLRSKDIESVNSYLSNKGWTFNGASEESEEKYSTTTWAYGKNFYTDRAKSLLSLMTAEGYYNRIIYRTVYKENYNSIRAKILSYKMTKVQSEAKDGYIQSIYIGDNYIVTLKTMTDSEFTIPVYVVVVDKKPAIQEEEILEESNNAETETSFTSDKKEEFTESIINKYKSMIDGHKKTGPKTEFLYLDENVESCYLMKQPTNTQSLAIEYLPPKTNIYVISELKNEDHEFFLVYANDYYGYINANNLKYRH